MALHFMVKWRVPTPPPDFPAMPLTGDPREQHSRLIFHWAQVRGVRRRLIWWILIAAAGHLGIFYLFRVAPAGVPQTPPPQQSLVYLPAGDPSSEQVFRSLNDRFPGTLPQSVDGDAAEEQAALRKLLPPWPPALASTIGLLKPLAEPLVPRSLPTLLQSGEPFLPQLPDDTTLPPPNAHAVADPAEDSTPLPSPAVTIGPGTAGSRTVIQQPTWPDALFDDTWPIHDALPFLLGVDASGTVSYAMMLAARTGIDQEAICRQVKSTRFTPGAAALQWITAEVRW